MSPPARGRELLGLTPEHVGLGGAADLGGVQGQPRRRWMVPGSPQAIGYLARYLDAVGTAGPEERVWRTMRGGWRAVVVAGRCAGESRDSAGE